MHSLAVLNYYYSNRDLAQQNNHTECVRFLKNPQDCRRRTSAPLVVHIIDQYHYMLQ